jgi:SulP family sulfate permease
MGQKDGEKWTAAADLQPTISKSDRLLGAKRSHSLGYGEHLQQRAGVSWRDERA